MKHLKLISCVGLLMLIFGCEDFSYMGSMFGDVSSGNVPPKTVDIYIGEAADIVSPGLKSRGSGVIENTDDFTDGRAFYIYAFNQDALTSFAVTNAENSMRCLIDGTLDNPGTRAGRAARCDTKLKQAKWLAGDNVFWPTGDNVSNRYDFFAYYVDDMVLDESDYHRNENDVVIDIEIDGSQDVMSSKASPSDEELEKLFKDEIDRINYKYYYCYSYDAAEKGLNPTFVFKHHLVRLRFKIVSGGTEGYTSDVTYEGVAVESRYQAAFKVADKADPSGIGLTFKPNYRQLELTEADGSSFTKKTIRTHDLGKGESKPEDMLLEGSLLVAPDSRYKLHLLLSEERSDGLVLGNCHYVTDVYRGSSQDNPLYFVAGNEYLVTLTTYGSMIVDVKVELTKWENGGDYIHDSDEEFETTTY